MPDTAAGHAQDVQPCSIGVVFGVNDARSRDGWALGHLGGRSSENAGCGAGHHTDTLSLLYAIAEQHSAALLLYLHLINTHHRSQFLLIPSFAIS